MRGASPVLPKCMVDGTKATVSTSPSFSISPSLHFHTGLVVEIILVNDHQLCAYWAGLPASPFCLQKVCQVCPSPAFPCPAASRWVGQSMPEVEWEEIKLCRSLLEKVAA